MRVAEKHVLRNALNLDITRELVITSWPELISIYYILNYIKRAFVIIAFVIAPSYCGHNVATYIDIVTPEIGSTFMVKISPTQREIIKLQNNPCFVMRYFVVVEKLSVVVICRLCLSSDLSFSKLGFCIAIQFHVETKSK